MKKKILVSFICLISLSSFSQQLYLEYGSTISNFDYRNSDEESLDNLSSTSNSYFAAGYRKKINKAKTAFLNLGVSYNNYGAVGSFGTLDNYFAWDLTYLGVNVGLDVRLFGVEKFSFYLKASLAKEFLIRGNQTINNQVYNLLREGEFNKNIIIARGGAMMHYAVTNTTALFVNYSYGKSFILISDENEEKLKIDAHQLGIGFIINLPSWFDQN
jgi:hypothetical protein